MIDHNVSWRKKMVTFENDGNKTYEIEPIGSEYSRRIWYSGDEIRIIISQNVCAADLMEKGTLVEGENQTSRGLESFIEPNDYARRQFWRKNSIMATIQEQKRQKDLGKVIYDPSLIALVYMDNGAKKSVEAARIRGLKDEVDAKILSQKAQTRIGRCYIKSKLMFAVAGRKIRQVHNLIPNIGHK